MDPVFFRNADALRKWFELNHQSSTELIVGYYKVGTGKDSITWSQSVDEAICFGWIDGIRRSIDQESYCIRFTPRRPGSSWSLINIQKARELVKNGMMHPSGLEAFAKRNERESDVSGLESGQVKLDMHFEEQFKLNSHAWQNFRSQAPSYQRITIRWVMSAKQEATRQNRLNELITACEAGEKIKAMIVGRRKNQPFH
jgi:uncharacterized protein YdeI (YjbR/CyaY-like superfamily)